VLTSKVIKGDLRLRGWDVRDCELSDIAGVDLRVVDPGFVVGGVMCICDRE
jgi:hypothetical protein